MRIDVKGEAALDVFAELLEPAIEITSDKEVAEAAQSGKKALAIKVAITNHKKAVIAILAALNGETPEQYAEKMTVFTLPAEFLRLLNDPVVKNLFTSQGRKIDNESSGSATESTEASGA